MSRFYGQNMKSKNDSVWGHNSRKKIVTITVKEAIKKIEVEDDNP